MINQIAEKVGKPALPQITLPKIPELKIPELASGAVIPPNREFLAVLGDNKREHEIVSPLSTMIEAFETALDRRGGGSNQPIMLTLNGRTIATAVWNENEKRYKQTGRR
jgi:hypothetical protein